MIFHKSIFYTFLFCMFQCTSSDNMRTSIIMEGREENTTSNFQEIIKGTSIDQSGYFENIYNYFNKYNMSNKWIISQTLDPNNRAEGVPKIIYYFINLIETHKVTISQVLDEKKIKLDPNNVDVNYSNDEVDVKFIGYNYKLTGNFRVLAAIALAIEKEKYNIHGQSSNTSLLDKWIKNFSAYVHINNDTLKEEDNIEEKMSKVSWEDMSTLILALKYMVLAHNHQNIIENSFLSLDIKKILKNLFILILAIMFFVHIWIYWISILWQNFLLTIKNIILTKNVQTPTNSTSASTKIIESSIINYENIAYNIFLIGVIVYILYYQCHIYIQKNSTNNAKNDNISLSSKTEEKPQENASIFLKIGLIFTAAAMTLGNKVKNFYTSTKKSLEKNK